MMMRGAKTEEKSWKETRPGGMMFLRTLCSHSAPASLQAAWQASLTSWECPKLLTFSLGPLRG